MRETKQTNINGVGYECTMMPATVAQKTLVQLVDALGHGAVSAIAGGFGGDGIERVADATMQILTRKLTPESTDSILMSVFNGVCTEGHEDEDLKGSGELNDRRNYDEHFAGRILTMYKVFAWSIQVNYADFFAVARSNPKLNSLSGRAEKVFSALIATIESGTSSSTGTPSTSETSNYSKQH